MAFAFPSGGTAVFADDPEPTEPSPSTLAQALKHPERVLPRLVRDDLSPASVKEVLRDTRVRLMQEGLSKAECDALIIQSIESPAPRRWFISFQPQSLRGFPIRESALHVQWGLPARSFFLQKSRRYRLPVLPKDAVPLTLAEARTLLEEKVPDAVWIHPHLEWVDPQLPHVIRGQEPRAPHQSPDFFVREEAPLQLWWGVAEGSRSTQRLPAGNKGFLPRHYYGVNAYTGEILAMPWEMEPRQPRKSEPAGPGLKIIK